MKSKTSIPQLYYRYKRVGDDEIRSILKNIRVVRKGDSPNRYFALNKKSFKKIYDRPRNVSLTFYATETERKPITDLRKWKTVTYLVKSSSRFFLKPDIGEIFDQIEFDDLNNDKFKGICFDDGYETLPGTDGEHHLMKATLLTSK